MLSDGVRRIGDGYGWAVEETAGGGDEQVIANANGNLVVICVCAGLGVHRRAIASARSSFSGLLVQCHELELFLDEHAVAGFLAPRVGASHRTEACLHRSWCRNMPQIVRGLVSRFRPRRLFLRLSSLAPLAVDMSMPVRSS